MLSTTITLYLAGVAGQRVACRSFYRLTSSAIRLVARDQKGSILWMNIVSYSASYFTKIMIKHGSSRGRTKP
ncbi:uncharacterized protein BDW70DRAFT_135066 [Aspergillus foveolatus]|uniref:uncharacterized protein n=1 Tax=Aspergillus foveolatus TaxID=210207 RepID=UPI003CCD584C